MLALRVEGLLRNFHPPPVQVPTEDLRQPALESPSYQATLVMDFIRDLVLLRCLVRQPTTGPGVGPAVPCAGGYQTFPDDLDIHSVPPEHKKEGTDWFAIFNPKATRQLEVSLVHTLMHERWTILHFVAE